jgi:glyoxylase-like metal-dependent hydrolase (beta-lactamase superfamily II)
MKEINHGDLTRRLAAGEDLSILDIRELDEFEDWHIAGAVNVPLYNAISGGDYSVVEEKLSAATLDKGKPVVAVCRSGNTSKVCVQALTSMGYEAASLYGGMRDWSNAWTEASIPFDGGVLLQVRRNGKGCLSYVVGAGGEAAVIDPCLDGDVYAQIADREGLHIKHVLETHVHADHISRARALAEKTGAALRMPDNDRVTFEYERLKDGDTLAIGGANLSVITTPGHTGESVSYYVDGKVLFSGDTVFADSIGRPDLEKGDAGAVTGAEMLYASLHDRVLPLPQDVTICPGHTAGAVGFDGVPICATLSDVKAKVDLLELGKEAFVKTVVESLGQKPPNFERVIAVNEGKANLGWLDPLELEAGPNRCAVR